MAVCENCPMVAIEYAGSNIDPELIEAKVNEDNFDSAAQTIRQLNLMRQAHQLVAEKMACPGQQISIDPRDGEVLVQCPALNLAAKAINLAASHKVIGIIETIRESGFPTNPQHTESATATVVPDSNGHVKKLDEPTTGAYL